MVLVMGNVSKSTFGITILYIKSAILNHKKLRFENIEYAFLNHR
jgi:hypothetical protein